MLPLLFMLSSLLVTAQQEWVWRIHPESGFKILSPFELHHKATELPTSSEPILYHQYQGGSLQDPSFPVTFIIDHYRLNEQQIGEDDAHAKEFFEVTVDDILHAVEGSLLYIDFLTQSGRQVCVWKGTYSNGSGVIRGQLIISGNRYYGLQAFGLASQKPDPFMQRFIDSFHLTEIPKP